MKKELICISCPQGCRLAVDFDEISGNCIVSGNSCPRGAVYAKQELTDPRRVVTAVMKTDDPENPLIPVRTDKPYPRAEIPALLNRLYQMSVKTPVKCGESVWENIDGTGINIIATETRTAKKSIQREEKNL